MKSEQFSPEIGQLCFCNSHQYKEFSCSHFIKNKLQALAEVIEIVEHNKGNFNFSAPIGNVGGHYQTDIFEMHSYYWGDCTCGYDQKEIEFLDNQKHSLDCYQTALIKIKEENPSSKVGDAEYHKLCDKFGIPWNNGCGCAIHCTCDYNKKWEDFVKHNNHSTNCPTILPNFKCDDFEVCWYKYLGRGMSMNREISNNEAYQMFSKCIDSVYKSGRIIFLSDKKGG